MALQIRPQKLAKQNQFPSSESQMPESIATLISGLSFSASPSEHPNESLENPSDSSGSLVHFCQVSRSEWPLLLRGFFPIRNPIFRRPFFVFPIEHGTDRLPIHQAVGLCHHTSIV